MVSNLKGGLMTKKQMAEYLKGHFRYDTMNGWNTSTSYAANVKLGTFVPRDLMDKAYEILEQGEVFLNINERIREFDETHNYQYQVGFNGRSGGYLVLYQGELKESGYKSYCRKCGHKNYTATKETGRVCGACGEKARVDFSTPHKVATVYPGKSLDMDEDFEEWDTDSLKSRVKLVKEFDELVKDCKKEFIYFCKTFSVKEETIQVPKKIKVLEEIVK